MNRTRLRNIFTLIFTLFIIIGTLIISVSCGSDTVDANLETTTENTSAAEDTLKAETEPPEETTAETKPIPDEDPLTDFNAIPEETTASQENKTESETVTEVNAQDTAADKSINPLTGIPSNTDLSKKRPIAVMINNLHASLPQEGIAKMDVLYECLVEGGTTRLMGVITNYEDLEVIGSVRSSREYYIDFAANHDAIYVHAGGSTEAYNQLQKRHINNLDGVNMYLPSTFYRDTERRKTMSLEHTLMTNGKGIVSGIEYKQYRTTIKDDFKNPLHFVDSSKVIKITGDTAASHIIIPYNSVQFPQYIYNSSTRLYKRYQFNGEPHMDGKTGEQLAFTNIIVVECTHYNTGDDKGHVNVTTTGNGNGYYITGGKYVKIKWNKATADSPISFTYENGSPIALNCGKTMINIVSPEIAKDIVFNYKK